MLDEKILDRTQRLIDLEFKQRLKKIGKDVAIIKEEMNEHGALYSSATENKIHERYEREIKEMCDLTWEKVKTAHMNIGAPFADTLAKDFKQYLNQKTLTFYDKLLPLHQKDISITRTPTKKDLVNARKEAIAQTEVEIDLYTDNLEIGNKTTNQNNVIFISHAAEDKVVAEEFKKQIENVLGDSIEVFVSSVPNSIDPGSEWLDRIIDCLMNADAILVIVTNTSINRRFVWFEIGFSWLRKLEEKCSIYPLCVPPISVGELPEPLSRLQAVALEDEERTSTLSVE